MAVDREADRHGERPTEAHNRRHGRGPDSDTNTQRCFERVCRALGQHRSGVHFPRIATDIIRPTHEGHTLLGFVAEGEAVAYHRERHGEVIVVPFDRHGLDRGATRIVAHGVSRPRAWVERTRDRFVWTVPAYRG